MKFCDRCIGILVLALLLATCVSTTSAQILPRPNLEWQSQYRIPFFPPYFGSARLKGADAATKFRTLCEDKREASKKMLDEILDEFIRAGDEYCMQFDRVYFETDIFGQQCLVNEYYRVVSLDVLRNFSGSGEPCDGLAEFIERAFAEVSMDGSEVTIQLAPGAGICGLQIEPACFGGPLPWRRQVLTAVDAGRVGE